MRAAWPVLTLCLLALAACNKPKGAADAQSSGLTIRNDLTAPEVVAPANAGKMAVLPTATPEPAAPVVTPHAAAQADPPLPMPVAPGQREACLRADRAGDSYALSPECQRALDAHY